MNYLSKFVVVLLLILCIPLQGVAAAIMPLGMAQQQKAAPHNMVMQQHGDHAGHDMPACHDMPQNYDQQAKHSPAKSTCDKSAHCPLCVAQAMVPAGLSLGPDTGRQLHDGLSAGKLQSIPSPFFRPPRLPAA